MIYSLFSAFCLLKISNKINVKKIHAPIILKYENFEYNCKAKIKKIRKYKIKKLKKKRKRIKNEKLKIINFFFIFSYNINKSIIRNLIKDK